MIALPTLRQLRYLVEVDRHRNFSRAADTCCVTQSTLSAGIRDLESLLGAVLLERDHRQVIVTPLGADIIKRAKQLLQDAEDLTLAARAGLKPLNGTLRLGAIPTIGPYLLPGRLNDIRRHYPDLRLFLREDQTQSLLRRLDEGSLDAAVIALPYDISGLGHEILGDDNFLLACAADHPLAAQLNVDSDRLVELDLLLLEDGHCLRDHALRACRLTREPAQNEAFQATSLATLLQMVEGGLGVTLIPEIAAEQEGRAVPGVRFLALNGDVPPRQLALVWRAGSPRESDFRLLAAELEL
ncbi:MAG: LysR substrate-binding domain-containing protein [Rhodospirillales bacterium]